MTDELTGRVGFGDAAPVAELARPWLSRWLPPARTLP